MVACGVVSKRWLWAIGVLLAVLLVVVSWPAEEADPTPIPDAEPTEAPPSDFDDPWGDDPSAIFGPFDEPADTGEQGTWRPAAQGGEGEEHGSRGERIRAFRDRMRNMSPDERRQWLRRRVSITAIGPGEPQIGPDEVMDALRATGPYVRECMQAQGGTRAFREAMRNRASADGGPGVRGRGLSVSFDLSADGTPVSDTIEIVPAPPEPYYECFAGALAQAEIPAPGAEAHIELHMGRHGDR